MFHKVDAMHIRVKQLVFMALIGLITCHAHILFLQVELPLDHIDLHATSEIKCA